MLSREFREKLIDGQLLSRFNRHCPVKAVITLMDMNISQNEFSMCKDFVTLSEVCPRSTMQYAPLSFSIITSI